MGMEFPKLYIKNDIREKENSPKRDQVLEEKDDERVLDYNKGTTRTCRKITISKTPGKQNTVIFTPFLRHNIREYVTKGQST
jgi:hypothetical protein